MKRRGHRRRAHAPPVEGRVRDLGARGEGVVVTETGTWFVAGALPGDVVRIRATDRRRGTLLEVLEPSPDRVEPACPFVRACGGCPLMPLSDEAERAFKVGRVHRATGIEPEWVTGSRLEYRRRARLGFGAGRIGYRRGRSRDLAVVEACVILAPVLERARRAITDRLADQLHGEGEIHLALGEAERAVVALVSATAQPPAVYDVLRALVADATLAGAEALVGGASVPAVFGDPTGVMRVAEGLDIRAPARAFAQANDEINRALVARVVELAEADGAEVLELYAGAGNFTLALARSAGRVTAFELDPVLVSALQQNAEQASLTNIVARSSDAVAGLAENRRADVVVLDPPRAGAKEATPGIVALRPQRVVMVSCDPATLERDVEAFAREGYRPDRVTAFDMFPHTAHVESCVRLVPVK